MSTRPPPPPDARQVSLLILDVDGVLTDGSIYLDDLGNETKRFNVRDGFAIKLWQKMGFVAAIITGKSGKAVAYRAHELGIAHVVQGASDKAAALDSILQATGARACEVACIGDDWPDLPLMGRIAYPMAVADADRLVLARAVYTTRLPGGRGAVREAIEHLLAAKGLMDRAAKLYDSTHAAE